MTTTPDTTGTRATSTYQVAGMTCDHCAMAVKRELSTLPGVRDVQVSLATGDVTVIHDQTPDQQQVAAAVDEAGYRLVC